MSIYWKATLSGLASLALLAAFSSVASAQIALAPAPALNWQVVVNNGVTVPGDTRNFNSYNQPSLNVNELVVFRARSKGGASGEPAHGVFTRDMKQGTGLVRIFDRTTLVPQPNNLSSTFVEPPSFPRIDMWSSTMASRGDHQPVWTYVLPDGTETRVGTTGIYTNPFGDLITGGSNLGVVPAFQFFAVPDTSGIKFDVFPGAPAVTDSATIVFKGNFTVPNPADPGTTTGKTGVYYRDLTNEPITLPDGSQISPAGGMKFVTVLADSDTLIPGSTSHFGSTAPPSAAGRRAVFTGLDNEDNPTLGGIYLVPLNGLRPTLTALVRIGDPVPGEKKGNVFNKLGEGLSYDGRFVAFWGAWGAETQSLTLQCPTDGNADRIAFCLQQYPNGFAATVPLHQGIFVYDTSLGSARAVAKTPADFDDFVYWNFSGLVPGTGESDETGEPARWRSAEFVAVSGLVDGELTDATFHTAFEARKGQILNGAYVNPVDGIYLGRGPGNQTIATIAKTGTDGTLIDPAAIDPLTQQHLPITALGIERDGFRGRWLAVSVSMGTEAAGWAGIYLTGIPNE
ncbi:MAG TPA: hypothetical protein VGR96_06880 [Acidobacteriaceae bacterium]|nr:hypothetical protein [Acidobacteriaceae bacterium]